MSVIKFKIQYFCGFRFNTRDNFLCPVQNKCFLPSKHSFETRTGPAGRPGTGRPGPGTGPGLIKNPFGSWPGETWSTCRVDLSKPSWDPAFYIYIKKWNDVVVTIGRWKMTLLPLLFLLDMGLHHIHTIWRRGLEQFIQIKTSSSRYYSSTSLLLLLWITRWSHY